MHWMLRLYGFHMDRAERCGHASKPFGLDGLDVQRTEMWKVAFVQHDNPVQGALSLLNIFWNVWIRASCSGCIFQLILIEVDEYPLYTAIFVDVIVQVLACHTYEFIKLAYFEKEWWVPIHSQICQINKQSIHTGYIRRVIPHQAPARKALVVFSASCIHKGSNYLSSYWNCHEMSHVCGAWSSDLE